MNEDLQQQLMEFVYGLLDEDEANALCERITSDPDVARAYAKVKLQCDLVGRAARFDMPTVAWIRPDGGEAASGELQPGSKTRPAHASRKLSNWCLGIAASALICLVGSSLWLPSRPNHNNLTSVAMTTIAPLQVVLTGPSRLNAEASSPFSIQVENQAGTPVSTTLNYRVYDTNGVVSWQDSASTDQSGVARFEVDASLARDASRLEVATADDSPAPILRALEASPERFATYLRMDRPLYQPGERLFYRSVTLSRFGLRAERELSTSFEIVNSSDEQIEGATNLVATEHGVGSGAFALPSDLPDGTYTLIVSNPDNLFRDEWRDFQVRRYAAPRLLKKLELAQDSYTSGDQVDVDFSVKRVAGEPLAELPLQVQATLDGLPLAAPEAKTDAGGNSRFSLVLPASIERGEASVSVTVQEGDTPAETITKEIPINLGKVNVDFYPEGGDLAAELPSRVYFYGRDPLGKPAHIEGRIVDSNNQEITEVITAHEGRGVFSLTPIFNETYRLIIERPAGVTKEIPLPTTSPVCFTTIETGAGVFNANAPIAFTVHQVYPVEPLIVAAYCRGAMIGQQTLNDDRYSTDNTRFATFRGEITLPGQAQGVIRLTVFDAAHTPPTPVAERLVYRRVGQRLDVRLTPDAETFAPGQSVQLDLAVRDENKAPVPAVLGIAIVDDAVLNLADDKSIRMPTYFHLLTELDSPEQLEDANFYLSDDSESVAALDSLLGTQGWRRFTQVPATQLAQAGGGGGFGGGGNGLPFEENDASWRYRSVAWAEEAAVPISTATTVDIRQSVLRHSTRSASATSSGGKSLASSIIIASVVLLVLVGAASLRRVSSNRSLRIFAGAVAVVSLLVGALSLPMKSSRLDRTVSDAALVDGEVAGAFAESETAIAAQDAEMLSENADSKRADTFMFQTDDAATLPDVPLAGEPIASKPSARYEAAPEPAPGDAAPGEQLRGKAETAVPEGAAELSVNMEKKKAALPDAQPRSEAAPNPKMPQPTADALSGGRIALAEQPMPFADVNERGFLRREYAKWFYDARASIPATDQSSSTIFWHPLFMADESGQATVYFNLPPRPSSFRAIVEAHGADRLGSGELLIDSQER
ncbi:MAG: MG2 domain-containing protein [Planctomycetota bacterium]|nr:MG2 domain-containing protein [Planctomycetota bacterium]